jgi:hypothetical protein
MDCGVTKKVLTWGTYYKLDNSLKSMLSLSEYLDKLATVTSSANTGPCKL